MPLLDSMITKFTIQQPRHQIYPPPLYSEWEGLEAIKDFLYPFGLRKDDALGVDIAYLSKLKRDTKKVLEITADQFSSFTRGLQSPLLKRLPPPYAKSFRRWPSFGSDLGKRFENSLQQTTDYIRSFLEHGGPRLESHDFINETDLAAEIDEIKVKSPSASSIVLFAVSGSGKTRSIERLLSHHFGFYFQACYVPLPTQQLHSAQRTSGSRDTHTLGKMIKYSQEIVKQANEVDETPWVTEWFDKLIRLRRIILAIFVDVAGELAFTEELLPRLWYKLQVSAEYDIFDEAFQILCLLPEFYREDVNLFDANPRLCDKQLYYCVDEAQDDIDTQLDTGLATHSLLSMWALAIDNTSWLSKKIKPLIIYSGTSLRTTEAVHAVGNRETMAWGVTSRSYDSKECSIFSSFPTVRDDKQFETVMSKHGWQQEVESKDKSMKALLKLIVQHAKPLYGRPGWSVRYLKNLREILPQDSTGDLTEDSKEEGSERPQMRP